ncbi:hypothetical protein [Streptomyces sp. NPDC015131]|uniref:RICIN domain-containing protein n=1 Tax=Streptomyces sp. NPDC015131 TaxID=3364941 RepID=UPI003700F835
MAEQPVRDLAEVDDTAGFVRALRRLKDASGLSYRQLEERAAGAGDVLPRSTAAGMLGRDVLPRPDQLAAFVRACGDGEHLERWLRARDRIAEGRPSTRPSDAPEGRPADAAPAEPVRRGRGAALAVKVAVPVLILAGAWLVTAAAGGPTAGRGGDTGAPAPRSPATPGPGTAGPASAFAPPSGWVRIRPVTAPGMCVTDGRVRDRRYTPLVAVQRPCAETAPQATRLEPVGGDRVRIQWHHPDYGKGCLKALAEGPGAGLLEPFDDCRQGSLFRLEASGSYTGGRYVLRVDGQGCVGIRDSATAEGTEAVMGRCVGRGGQVFLIEPA